ncbi:MAG: hypothetical protein ABIH59_02605 [archaeon]
MAKNKLKAFKEQHFKIMKCLLINNKPMGHYDVSKDKSGFNNRQRSGEVIPYFDNLLEFNFIKKELIKKKEKYFINYDNNLIEFYLLMSKFRKDSKRFLIEMLEKLFSVLRINKEGKLGIDKNFNSLEFNQYMNKKYETITPSKKDALKLLKLYNSLSKDKILFI